MKTLRLSLVAALAAATPVAPVAAPPAPWLVANLPTCELDGRRLPSGATSCVQGQVWLCSASGTWTNTNKPC